MLIGAAMQAGVPIRLDTPVYQTMLGSVPADLDPRKKAMTLEHLISMTAGFDCDDSGDRPGDEDPMQEQTAEPDWYRYTLNVPMAWNSGEKIVYCSMKPNLAAGMLEKIAGEPLPEMFHRLVAKPLHMGTYHLFLQPTGQAYGGGGHHFTTRDFMKLTQLFLNDGRWEGRQIVSREWARKSGAALRVLSPRSGQTYGYLWNSVRIFVPRTQAARVFSGRERRPGLHRDSRPRPADCLHRRQLRRRGAVPTAARVRAARHPASSQPLKACAAAFANPAFMTATNLLTTSRLSRICSTARRFRAIASRSLRPAMKYPALQRRDRTAMR